MRRGLAIAILVLGVGGLGLFLVRTVATIRLAQPAEDAPQDPIEGFKAQRDAVIDRFRIGGQLDLAAAAELAQRLRAYLPQASGEAHTRALYELATIERISNQFAEAVQHYEAVIAEASRFGLRDLQFSAALGIARCHAYGTHRRHRFTRRKSAGPG